MNVAVLQFPGSNCDQDAFHAFATVLGVPTRLVWHKETSLGDADFVVVPGGFSFGDYLRCGAIARFSPVMAAVKEFGMRGGRILGICNGFQILCEAGLLPGALVRNECLEFRCMTVNLKVEESTETWNPRSLGKSLRIPIAHGEGNYRLNEADLKEMEENNQVLFRYADTTGEAVATANPNGSTSNIAGIRNRDGNILAMMPHPERAVEWLHPSQDGHRLLAALIS